MKAVIKIEFVITLYFCSYLSSYDIEYSNTSDISQTNTDISPTHDFNFPSKVPVA